MPARSRSRRVIDPGKPEVVEPGGRAPGLERLAWLMDSAVTIPGTNITVGLDALLGLLPIGGDVMTGLIQLGLVLYAVNVYKVPRAVAARMLANVLLDVGVGTIPFVGDVFDVFFKANTRNLKLLGEVRQATTAGKPIPTGPSKRYLIGLGVAIGAVLVLALIGFIALLMWVFRQHPLW